MGLIFTNIPELEGSDTEIVLSNLSELEGKFEALVERRLAHICELSRSVIVDGEDFDIIKSILLSMLSDGVSDDGNMIEENRKNADLIYSNMSLCERLVLYRQICKNYYSKYKESLCEKYFFDRVLHMGDGKIAYVKNTYSDEAYLKLSGVIASPKAIYFDNVEAVCEAVALGKCKYCIIPTEANGAKIASFYGYITKYGLCKVCEYDLKSDNETTRYSLLCSLNVPTDKSHRGKTVCEICIPLDETDMLSRILTCGDFCAMGLYRIDTVDKNIFISFKSDRSDINTFMMYLAIEYPGARLLGIYKNIQ